MNRDGNYMKTCREMAGYTQERAAEYLPFEIRTLQRYEAEPEKAPFDAVAEMASLYDRPLLVLWWLGHIPVISKYLHIMDFPDHPCEVSVMMDIMRDNIHRCYELIKQSLLDRKWTFNDLDTLMEAFSEMIDGGFEMIIAALFIQQNIQEIKRKAPSFATSQRAS